MKKILAVLLTVLLFVQPISLSVSAFDFNDGTLTWPEICDKHTYDHGCDPTCNKCGLGREVPDHVYDNACDANCNVCGTTRTPAAHVYDNACDANCNVCGATRTPAAHVYDNACDPTCNVCGMVRTVAGHLIYGPACADRVCVRCSTVISATEPHTYSNDCDTNCDACGAARTVVGHAYASVDTVPATCGADGVRTYTCTTCGDSYTESIPATGEHVYDMVVTDPTCVDNGHTVYTCAACGYKFTINIPAVGHDYETTVVEPRCDAQGYDLHTCTVCGDSYQDNFTPARTEHGYIMGNEFYSCTEPCYIDYSCLYCGDTYREYSEPTGHTPRVYPTIWICQQYTYCDNFWCNEILTPATGHLHTDLVEHQDPTCDEEGYNRYCCYGCPNYKTEVIPATGHTYGDACDADCDVCSATRTPPHDYADPYDAICDLCGAAREVSDFRVGDVNGDGKINVRDLGLLQQYLNGWDVDISVEAADVSRDGKVNVRDLGKLQQYLNGWDVEFV